MARRWQGTVLRVSRPHAVMSAEIAIKPVFQSLPGEMLFQVPRALGDPPAATGDGKRFLVGPSWPKRAAAPVVTVATN